MNALLTVQDFEAQAIAVEYIGGEEMDVPGEDPETVLAMTLDIVAPAVPVADADSLSEDAFLADVEVPVFDDEFPIIAEAEAAMEDVEDDDEEAPAADPRLTEMRDVLVTLRDSEVGQALRLLRQRFPHIPFPFRVRALMAVRHGALAS